MWSITKGLRMGKIKDSLGCKQVVTLEKSEIEYLVQTNAFFQQELERLQQQAAANFLRFVAINRFEYAPVCDLRFNLDITKSEDNLEITNVTE
jgi:hypothetical protein